MPRPAVHTLLPVLLLFLVMTAACGDAPTGPEPTPETPLAESLVAPLVVASDDVRDRLLPAIAEAPNAAAVGTAARDLAAALETRLPSRIEEAAALLDRALDQAAADDHPASAPDRDAIRLFVLAVRQLPAGS